MQELGGSAMGSVTAADAWAEEVDHDSGGGGGGGGERGRQECGAVGGGGVLGERRGAVGFGERRRRCGMEGLGSADADA
jgi:hypothetical protein